MTPDQVHYGQADEVYAARQQILDRAFQSKPERFVKKPPEPPLKPTAVWINPPTQRLGGIPKICGAAPVTRNRGMQFLLLDTNCVPESLISLNPQVCVTPA